MNGGADIRPVEYLADLYLNSGRNIARVTAPGRLLNFYGGHAIVRDLRDVLWALQQEDVTVQPTARYWEFTPEWLRAVQDPKQGGREANVIAAAVVLPAGYHIGLPPDYAIYHERDTVPVPYGWETPEPPPPPSSPAAHCPICDTLLRPTLLKAKPFGPCCSQACNATLVARTPAAPPLPPVPCAWCGEAFTPRWLKTRAGEPYLTRYCGEACAKRAVHTAQRVNAAHAAEAWKDAAQRRAGAPPTPCAHCGGLFHPYKSHGALTRYCSRTCSQAVNVARLQAAHAEARGAPS